MWLLSLHVAGLLLATPRAAAWPIDQPGQLAAVVDGHLLLAVLRAGAVTALPSAARSADAVVVAGGQPLVASGTRLARLADDTPVATFAQPILQLVPVPANSGLVVLTGQPASPAPLNSQVWYLSSPTATPAPVASIRPAWRPWRVSFTQAAGQSRLVVSTWKRTRFVPFEHNALFVFAWHEGQATAWWLGSRLAQPYRDAIHGALRDDGLDRLVAVEETAAGDAELAVYRPIGFGYEGEWRSAPVAGLQGVARLGPDVVAWGRGADTSWLRRLAAAGEAYELAGAVHGAPDPADCLWLGARRLAWCGGEAWQVADLP